MSHFVTESIRESLKKKSEQLAKEYAEANKDTGQRDTQKDWESTISDGLGVDNDW
jgi:hypothetical protein